MESSFDWQPVRDAVWISVLAVCGFVAILIDVEIGFATILARLTQGLM